MKTLLMLLDKEGDALHACLTYLLVFIIYLFPPLVGLTLLCEQQKGDMASASSRG